MFILDKKLQGSQSLGTGEPLLHPRWMSFIQTSPCPSPRKIPLKRHPQRLRMKARMKGVKWQHRSRRLTRSDVDQVEPRVGTRHIEGSRNFFRNLLRERRELRPGPLKRKIAHWLWSSVLLRSVFFVQGEPAARASRNDSLLPSTLSAVPGYSLDRASGSDCCHVFELSIGALYCNQALVELIWPWPCVPCFVLGNACLAFCNYV